MIIVILVLAILSTIFLFKSDKFHLHVLFASILLMLTSLILMILINSDGVFELLMPVYFISGMVFLLYSPYMIFQISYKKNQSFSKSLIRSYLIYTVFCILSSVSVYFLLAPRTHGDAIIGVIFVIIGIIAIFLINAILLPIIEHFLIKSQKNNKIKEVHYDL